MGWRCGLCDEEHDELPLVYGADAPWRMLVPEDEFDGRVELDDGLCVVDREYFFVRGHIQLPIRDHDEPFARSVWCSVSKESFVRMMKLWDDPERVRAEPYFAWLSTSLPTRSGSVMRGVRARPSDAATHVRHHHHSGGPRTSSVVRSCGSRRNR